MAHQIRADYTQDYLFPPSVEEWLGAEHPARFIRAFVDALELDALGIVWKRGEGGRPAYSADLLLKVWLYGYYQGLRSTRKLEVACRDNLGLVWLTGMHAPDHNTLWRFFDANRKGLRALFRQSVQVAVKADLIGMALHALDGTKVSAPVANASGWHRPKLEALLAQVDEALAQWETEVAQSAHPEQAGTGLPEHLQDAAQLRAKVLDALGELDAAGQNHLNPHDPDARVMKCPDRNMNTFAYNAQAVVDEQSGLLVAEDVVTEANDLHQLPPMLQHVEDQLGACAETTVADTGYASGAALAQAEDAKHNVLVNLPATQKPNPNNPYHASNFSYDPEQDVVHCPRGEALAYQHTREHKNRGYTLRLYRCHNKTCPVRDQCTQERKGRGIELTPYHRALDHQRQKHHDPTNQAILRKRRALIEPVFGIIKENHGFRRFTLRGLDGAKTQWALICTAYNLHKLYKAWREHAPHTHPAPT